MRRRYGTELSPGCIRRVGDFDVVDTGTDELNADYGVNCRKVFSGRTVFGLESDGAFIGVTTKP